MKNEEIRIPRGRCGSAGAWRSATGQRRRRRPTCCISGQSAPTPRPSPSSARCTRPRAASGSRPPSPATPPTRSPSSAPTWSPATRRRRCSSRARRSPSGTRPAAPPISTSSPPPRSWDKVVAPELLPVMKPDGHWVAAPMNIHRINWLWASKKVLDDAGITELPKTWAEFNADCEKIVADRQDLHRPPQRRLDRRHALRSDRLRPGHRPLSQGLRRGRPRCAAQRGHGQGLRPAAPDGRRSTWTRRSPAATTTPRRP